MSMTAQQRLDAARRHVESAQGRLREFLKQAGQVDGAGAQHQMAESIVLWENTLARRKGEELTARVAVLEEQRVDQAALISKLAGALDRMADLLQQVVAPDPETDLKLTITPAGNSLGWATMTTQMFGYDIKGQGAHLGANGPVPASVTVADAEDEVSVRLGDSPVDDEPVVHIDGSVKRIYLNDVLIWNTESEPTGE